jgi:hypothetical protein
MASSFMRWAIMEPVSEVALPNRQPAQTDLYIPGPPAPKPVVAVRRHVISARKSPESSLAQPTPFPGGQFQPALIAQPRPIAGSRRLMYISKSAESRKLRPIVDHFEESTEKIFQLEDVVARFDVKRRLLYDFVICLNSLRLCRKVSTASIEWFGVKRLNDTVLRILEELREEITSHKTVKTIFCTGRFDEDPFENAAWNVIKMFLYLGTGKLDLRTVAALLTERDVKYKTMLRRLYTVASTLEGLDVIRKTEQTAEVELIRLEWLNMAECRELQGQEQRRREMELLKRREFIESFTMNWLE